MQPWLNRPGAELTARDWIIITAVGGIIVALIIATVKGSLVAAFFMHLSAERKVIYWVLALTATFVMVMVGLIMFARGDQQGLQHGIFEVPQGHVPIHPAE